MSRRKMNPELQRNLDRTEWTGNDLLKAKLPEPEWIVPRYLPMGLTILAGRPFAGKSFLALQLAGALRSNQNFLGERVLPRRCLYIAREDINASLRKRITGQHWQPASPAYDVDIFTTWERFKKGGLEHLRKQLAVKEYGMVVLDSLYKFLTGTKNEKDGEMEPVMSELQDLYKKGTVDSILCLAHTNKLSVTAGDGGESAVSGDTALMGVADNYWMLYHRGNTKQMFFHAEGRLMERVDLPIHFDKQGLCWHLTTAKDRVKLDSVRGLLLSKFNEQERPLTATVLSELTGKPVTLVIRELTVLCEEHLIERLPKQGVAVFYRLAPSQSGSIPVSFLDNP